MKLNRYTFPCYKCEGGTHEGPEDNEGYRPRVNCRWCYRGWVTIELSEGDEHILCDQLTAAINKRSQGR